jgi:riboflavin biosynthesis pyrimidine reductase
MNDLFFAENLVDRLHLTLVSRVLGGKADTVDRMPVHRAFKLVKQEVAEEDLFLEYERVSQF